MPTHFTNTHHLEETYFKEVEQLKRKLKKGICWKDLLKEREAMTRLAIAIHENHHQSFTSEKPLFGERNV